jgi:hypothetical protein
MAGTAGDDVDLRMDVAHPARMYDYLLGGKDNYEADRAAAAEGFKVNPSGRTAAMENRAFLQRAVRYLAEEAGVRQFLDIGTGIPTSPNVHEVAQGIAPESRVVYVDNDPIVLAHARALLASSPQGRTAYIDADLHDVDAIMADPELRSTLDLERPVALLLIALLHFVPDSEDPKQIVDRMLAGLPAGSFLVLSHLTGDFNPQAWSAISGIWERNGVAFQVRSEAEVARLFDGLEMVEPGLQVPTRWRPDLAPAPAPDADDAGPRSVPPDADVSFYAGIARKP